MSAYDEVIAAKDWLHTVLRGNVPKIGIVLGTGFDSLTRLLLHPCTYSFSDIPGFVPSGTEKQANEVWCGHAAQEPSEEMHGTFIMMVRGGAHLYDGASAQQVVLPVRVMVALGCEVIIFVNAAGAITSGYRPGDLLVVSDHNNQTGTNPFEGPHDARLGARFPGMSRVYDRELRNLVIAESKRQSADAACRPGVYAGVRGPAFETPAEVAALRTAGADMVGTSIVLSAMAARQMGARCVGICCITNAAASADEPEHSREDVLATTRDATAKLDVLLRCSIPKIVEHLAQPATP